MPSSVSSSTGEPVVDTGEFFEAAESVGSVVLIDNESSAALGIRAGAFLLSLPEG